MEAGDDRAKPIARIWSGCGVMSRWAKGSEAAARGPQRFFNYLTDKFLRSSLDNLWFSSFIRLRPQPNQRWQSNQ